MWLNGSGDGAACPFNDCVQKWWALGPTHIDLSLPFSLSSGRLSSITVLILLFFYLFLFLFQNTLSCLPFLPPFTLFWLSYPFPCRSGKVSHICPSGNWGHHFVVALVDSGDVWWVHSPPGLLSCHPVPRYPPRLCYCSFLGFLTSLDDTKTFPWKLFFP